MSDIIPTEDTRVLTPDDPEIYDPAVHTFHGQGANRLMRPIKIPNASESQAGIITAALVALINQNTLNLNSKASVDSLTQAISDLTKIINERVPIEENGKISESYLPDSIIGQVSYKGLFDPSSFTVPDVTTTTGDYYMASVDGSITVNAGEADEYTLEFVTGDWIISNGQTWDKVDNTDAVCSINGRMGHITLSKDDVGLSNVDNTSDAEKVASGAIADALNIDQILGLVSYQGVFSCEDEDFELPAAADSKYHYYICTDETGDLVINSGDDDEYTLNFVTADWLISNGAKWFRCSNFDGAKARYDKTKTASSALNIIFNAQE